MGLVGVSIAEFNAISRAALAALNVCRQTGFQAAVLGGLVLLDADAATPVSADGGGLPRNPHFAETEQGVSSAGGIGGPGPVRPRRVEL
jgi:hypothetical protein